MPRNVEVKAKVDALEPFARRAASLASAGPFEIVQDDTFFPCPNGRLKLRALGPTEGQLIFYRREDLAGPKESFFTLFPTSSPETLRDALSEALGCAGRVRKQRTLYLVGRTRVHLDRVEGLGEFLELEVILGEGEPGEEGARVARELMAELGISASQLVEGAYVDLLAARPGPSGP